MMQGKLQTNFYSFFLASESVRVILLATRKYYMSQRKREKKYIPAALNQSCRHIKDSTVVGARLLL
jgi:hypothetical protein